MKRISKRPSIYEVSRTKHSVRVTSDWRYYAFFRLLQISPSYWQAHQLETGKPAPDVLPTDIQAVRRTYRQFGEVWSRPYWDWWFDVGQYEFGTDAPPTVVQLVRTSARSTPSPSDLERLSEQIKQHYVGDLRRVGWPATMLLSVPLTGGKKEVLRQIDALFEEAAQAVSAPRTAAPFQMIRNKVRDVTVDQAIRAVQARSEYPDESLFAVGVRAKFSRSYAEAGNRTGLAQLVSRHLLHAHRLCENAASGLFPSLVAIPDTQPAFDFALIRRQQRDHAELSWDALQKIPAELRTNEHRFAGSNRTITYDDGPMKEYQLKLPPGRR